ncbi:MAG: cohesin domain-containing protein [Dehalococcoidia bacterium]|nr:cohesin domain-containing protein [Dehalococcoidia bacterium]
MSRRNALSLLLCTAGIGLFCLAAALSPGSRPAYGQSPVMKVAPASQTVQMAGPTFNVDIVLENVSNLGAFEFTLSFDPDIVRFVGVGPGPFLGSTGRELYCPRPLHYSPSSGDPALDAVRFGCVSSDQGAGTPGASGSGVVANLQFAARAPGQSVLGLGLSNEVYGIADIFGNGLYVTAQSGSVTVEGSITTPTSTPRADEPTPIPTQPPPPIQQATPTRHPDALSWLTPQPGETPMARLVSDADPSGSGAAGRTGGSGSAARSGGTAQTNADGSPRAGTGPPQYETAWWPTLAGGLLAAGGIVLLSLAYSIRPPQRQKRG